MKRFIMTVCGFLCVFASNAQHGAEAAYSKLTQLTAQFQGAEPYSCKAIIEVQYNNKAESALKDTSLLIYKNRSTFYKSRLVEKVEAPEGELIINHELKTASLHISDSLMSILQKELKVKQDKEFEAMLDSAYKNKDQDAFRSFITSGCNVDWKTKDGLDIITFTPKNIKQSALMSITIKFDQKSKIHYYEYVNREIYANDMSGNSKFRMVKTIYDDFVYTDVPNIPAKLTDFLEWRGWTIKLKKYTNYKLTVL